MASQADLLQSCVEEAAKAAKPALERCIDDAVAGLQIAETQSIKVADRNVLADACRELLRNKPAWLAQYPYDLLQAFEAGVSSTAFAALTADAQPKTPAASTLQPRLTSSGRLSLEGLSLVDDADVSQAIEASRLLQQVLPAVDAPLTELDKLISAAQGLASVRRELNPLRPEVFTNVLRDMIFAAPVAPAIASQWIRYMAAPLGRELKLVYERAVNQLEMANVQAVTYRVLQTPSGGGGGGGAAPGAGGKDGKGNGGKGSGAGGQPGGSGRPGSGAARGGQGSGDQAGGAPARPIRYIDLSDHGEHNALFRKFLQSDGGGLNEHALAPAYYDDIEEELRALRRAPDSVAAPVDEDARDSSHSQHAPSSQHASEQPSGYRAMPAVDRPKRAVGEGSQLSQKVWGVFARRKARALVRTQLKKDAKKVSQVLGLEMVRKLVNQVAQDPRLLSPVREAIVALEPSLGRLAMVDPRFFSEESHAGRRLMERVAQRSFKYNDEFSLEFSAFFEPVAAQFNQLNGLTIEDAGPFAQALAQLEASWTTQDQAEAAQRNAMLQALRFAEERQAQADDIAFDLSQRTDLDGVPGLILDFLFGPWALVMAHARLADARNQVDPQGFASLVPDLIWSAKRDMTLKQPAKLIEMIPGLLAKLHEGLNLLGKDPAETEEFFEGLMRLHQPVLKLRRKKSLQDAEESAAAPLEPEEPPATPEQRLAKAAEQPWLARNELEAAGFENTLPSDMMVLGAAGKADAPAPAEPDAVYGADSALPPDTDAAASGEDGQHDDTQGDPDPDAIKEEAASQMLSALRAGSWVDLYARRRWRRAQLVWASGKGTLFMFVSHGGQPHSMTRRSCERLIRDRLLRPVAMHGVVAHALDAVAQEAALQAAANDSPPQ